MRILVTGANGYIGLQTAKQLRLEGYTVYGLIRNKEHASVLEKAEIIPVVSEFNDAKNLEGVLDKVTLVIDNVMAMSGQDPNKFADANKGLVALLQASAKRTFTRKRYIYTSGCLVYGSQPGKVLTEEDPLLTKFLTWRVDWEREVLALGHAKDSLVDGTVIRPGFVYGEQWSPIVTPWFSGNKDGDIEISGSPDKRWAWIHVYDLAAAYVAVVDHKNTIGELFNIGDESRPTYAQAKEAFGRAGGATGKVVLKPAGTDFWSMLLECSCVVSSEKLKKFTGWKPKLGPVLDQLEIYNASIKAYVAAGGAKKGH